MAEVIIGGQAVGRPAQLQDAQGGLALHRRGPGRGRPDGRGRGHPRHHRGGRVGRRSGRRAGGGLTPAEMPGLRPFINALMVEIGLAARRGRPILWSGARRALRRRFRRPDRAILAGLGGGDWDRIERRWNLHRYGAMKRHWVRQGPPAYMAVAAYVGLPRSTSAAAHTIGGEELMNLLRTFPGGDQGLLSSPYVLLGLPANPSRLAHRARIAALFRGGRSGCSGRSASLWPLERSRSWLPRPPAERRRACHAMRRAPQRRWITTAPSVSSLESRWRSWARLRRSDPVTITFWPPRAPMRRSGMSACTPSPKLAFAGSWLSHRRCSLTHRRQGSRHRG